MNGVVLAFSYFCNLLLRSLFHNLFIHFGVLTVLFAFVWLSGCFSSLLVKQAHEQIKDTLSRCSALLSHHLRDNLSRTRFVFGTILRRTSVESVPLCILCHIVDRITVDSISRDELSLFLLERYLCQHQSKSRNFGQRGFVKSYRLLNRGN